MLVLIDADADIYMVRRFLLFPMISLTLQFNEKFLSRGLAGGQSAADQFMEKVREHLASPTPAIDLPKTVPVIVKAFANLGGLAQACVRDRKLNSVADLSQFWIGFTRRYPLVDFVDVGSGKEEADNKLRGDLLFFNQSWVDANRSRGAELLYR